MKYKVKITTAARKRIAKMKYLSTICKKIIYNSKIISIIQQKQYRNST
jgi:hypothetical protein